MIIPSPSQIEVIGNTLSLVWQNGEEVFLDSSFLRANSPSAENKGEVDIFGQVSGGSENKKVPNVKIIKIFPIGNYAIRILFSDGHSSGIFSWKYLQELHEKNES